MRTEWLEVWFPHIVDNRDGWFCKPATASEWKSGYHSGRAMLNAEEWLGAEQGSR